MWEQIGNANSLLAPPPREAESQGSAGGERGEPSEMRGKGGGGGFDTAHLQAAKALLDALV